MEDFYWIINRLKKYNTQDALIYKENTYSYKYLYDESIKIVNFLQENNIPEGAVISLEGDFTPYTCAAIMALVNNNNIIIPIAASAPEVKKQEYIEISQVEYRLILDDQNIEIINRGINSLHEFYEKLRGTHHAGLVLFSSGTTGSPKATVLDFNKLIDNHREERVPHRTLAFLSLDHIGGINTLLHALSHGGALIVPESRTPENVFEKIQNWFVDVLPTTPTFLNMVLISSVLDRIKVPSLKLITYGTEPMPIATLNKLNQLLPNVKFKQTYGLSEVGILPTKSKDNNELWLKLGSNGFKHKIKNNVLWVKSDFAMLGYLNSTSPFDDEGYFNTGDIVELDDNNEYMRILGRQTEIINVGGEKVYPSEVENVILQASNIIDVTVVGVPNPITGMGVKAVIRLSEDEDYDNLRARLFAHCKEKLENFKIPLIYEINNVQHHSDRFKKMRTLFKAIP